MGAFAKLSAALLLLAGPSAGLAQGLASALPPSEPAAVAAAAQSCGNAIVGGQLEEPRLIADGWTLFRDSGGPSVATQARVYMRGPTALMVMGIRPGCTVIARFEDSAATAALVQAMTRAFGPAQTGADGSTVWTPPNGIGIQLRPSPSGVRIVVAPR